MKQPKMSKNWDSRKAVIAPYHVEYLKGLAEETGIDSLSDAVNHLIADYRKLQNTNTNTNINTSNLSNTADTSSVEDDDFDLGDLI